jgi:hypothetical protein
MKIDELNKKLKERAKLPKEKRSEAANRLSDKAKELRKTTVRNGSKLAKASQTGSAGENHTLSATGSAKPPVKKANASAEPQIYNMVAQRPGNRQSRK